MSSLTINGVAGRQIQVPTGLFIRNAFVPAAKTLAVENPTTGETLGKISAAGPEDVDKAVASAILGYKTWRATTTPTRAKMLLRLAELIERDAEELASLEAVDAGLLYNDSMQMSIPQSAAALRYYAGWADKIDGKTLEMDGGVAYTHREPLGVCAAIVPWNTPLMITIWNLAPALATGNVLIIKPSELSPLYAQKLATLIREAQFPAGVVNIVCGDGASAGRALSEHMLVRKIAFTGSTATGREILKASAATNLKQVSLELGGKRPSIVFDDCDLENALLWTRIGITTHNGQICAAGSRIYVQKSIYGEFLRRYKEITENAPGVIGDPLDPNTTKGPIVSRTQHEKVLSYIEQCRQAGSRLLFGGERVGDNGYFVQDTAFVDVPEDATILKEEIFGPVVCITPFNTEDDAIRMANDSMYGLSAAIFSNDVNRTHRVTGVLDVDHVTVNSWAMLSSNVPFGGVKESGFGRDMAEDALESWTAVKAVKYSIPPAKL